MIKTWVVNFVKNKLGGKIRKRVLAPILLALGIGAEKSGTVDYLAGLAKHLIPEHTHTHTHGEDGAVSQTDVSFTETKIPPLTTPQLPVPETVIADIIKAVKCE